MAPYDPFTQMRLGYLLSTIESLRHVTGRLQERAHAQYDARSGKGSCRAQFLDHVDHIHRLAETLDADLSRAHMEVHRLTMERACSHCARRLSVLYRADTPPPAEDTFVCQVCIAESLTL